MPGVGLRKIARRRAAIFPLLWMRGMLVSLLVALSVGAAAGAGLFTFIYAKGSSYLTNDASACVNCHIMQANYDGWIKSSHRSVATCNDCHTPHEFVGKWTTKALNGFNHSLAFTTGRFHEPIRMTPRNERITQAACRHCHEEITQAIDHGLTAGGELDCLRCHAGVGHGPE